MNAKQRVAGLMTDLETSQARVAALESELADVRANMVATGHANSTLQVRRAFRLWHALLNSSFFAYIRRNANL